MLCVCMGERGGEREGGRQRERRGGGNGTTLMFSWSAVFSAVSVELSRYSSSSALTPPLHCWYRHRAGKGGGERGRGRCAVGIKRCTSLLFFALLQ